MMGVSRVLAHTVLEFYGRFVCTRFWAVTWVACGCFRAPRVGREDFWSCGCFGDHIFGLENFLKSRFWCRKKKELWQGFLGATTLTCHQLDFVALLKASAPDTPQVARSGKGYPEFKDYRTILDRPRVYITQSKLHARAHARMGKLIASSHGPLPALPRPTAFWAVPHEIPGVFPGHPTHRK